LALEVPLLANTRGHMGTGEDALALLKLAGDGGSIKGFPSGMTVGSEAKRVAAVLENKGK
jgi:hypothetical protein